MTTSEIDNDGSLESKLELASVTVRRGSELIGSHELSRLRSILVHDLRGYKGCRVALTSPQAEHVLIGVAAAQAVGCELLLHRTTSLSGDLLNVGQISAVIDSSMRVTKIEYRNIGVTDVRILISTSGTTGEPKLAEHSLGALFGRIRKSPRSMDRARWLLTYHPATFGGLQVLLTVLTTGADLITVASPTIPALCEAALAYRPTHVSATPTFWRLL